jgi:hypothetical protein
MEGADANIALSSIASTSIWLEDSMELGTELMVQASSSKPFALFMLQQGEVVQSR